MFHFCYDRVYSVKKMPVGGAAIIAKLTICHVILLPSKSTIYQKYVVQASSVLFFVLILFFFTH